MARNFNLKPNQAIWVFQAGWDIGLARDLPEKVQEFHGLKPESFGRNISLFKVTTSRVGTAALGCPAERSSAVCTLAWNFRPAV